MYRVVLAMRMRQRHHQMNEGFVVFRDFFSSILVMECDHFSVEIIVIMFVLRLGSITELHLCRI